MNHREDQPARQPPSTERKAQETIERFELLGHVTRLLDPVMMVLGLAFLVLMLVEFAGGTLTIGGVDRLDDALT